MKADFSGYATKAGLRCSDGRTIMPDAFKHQDKMRVPLVWQHGHDDVENVLGHAILENRQDGVYAYCFFNKSGKAGHAHELVEHGDITMMSIWANKLIERSGKVLHGAIREVSLVLSGANPGALIENVTIRHGDGDDQILDDEVIIYTGLQLEHASGEEESKDEKKEESEDGETLKDVYESMNEKQKEVVHHMIGVALESTKQEEKQEENGDAEHSNTKTDSDKEGNTKMTRNVFEKGADKSNRHELSHDDIKGILLDAVRPGNTLKSAVEDYALAHGITDIDTLFPDAQAIDTIPEWIKRRTDWVAGFMNATRKTPFSRIKSLSADLTFEDARAKGYIKGTLKKEQFFAVAKRITTPTTVYKKQKLDRDDLIDITDFDVVAWLKQEMRFMLDEEIARAALIGDGRDIADEDKIRDGSTDGVGIRPIATDDEFYTTQVYVQLGDANSTYNEVVDAVIRNRSKYRGSGTPNFYTTETHIGQFLTLRDNDGHRMYKTLADLAAEMRVGSVIPVEVMEEEPDIIGIIANPSDYVFGATRGGQVSFFEDFDIDYNQQKYLIETRVSGALTKHKTALVIREATGVNALVTPAEPAFDPETGALTITDQTGVVYKHGATVLNNAGSPYTVPTGTTWIVDATPAAGYAFPSSDDDQWSFTAD